MSGAEIAALVGKGLQVSSIDAEGGKHFSSRSNISPDGRISGTLNIPGQQAIPFSGAWKLKGAQFCRMLNPIQPEEVCETWVKTGAREFIVQVGGKDASVARW